MKKILIIFTLFFINISNIFANKDVEDNIYMDFREFPYEKSLTKIDFSKNNFELLNTKIIFHNKEEYIREELKTHRFKDFSNKKIDFLPEILKNIPKNKVEELIKNDKLQIFWDYANCWAWETKEMQNCNIIENNNFYVNTKIEEIYKVYAEKDENITMYFYPISPDYNIYTRHYYVDKKPILTVFTNNLDIFNPGIYDLENKIDSVFEKNYKLVKTKQGTYMYIPYYKTTLKLKKWENYFNFNYLRFTEYNNSWEIILNK